MSHFQSHHQYGQGQPQATDEYGNPILNPNPNLNPDPVHHTTGLHGTTATTTRGLHRSGSSSSSSSEEDEHGVRRKKKGMKEKIKEKIPGVGGHHDQSSHATSTTTPVGYEAAEHHHEKKGIIDKIKDKIPGTGTHHQGQQNY